MPELFGVCTGNHMPSKGLDAFQKIQNNLLAFRQGSFESKALEWVSFGTVFRYKNDPAVIKQDEHDGSWLAWIGNYQEENQLSQKNIQESLTDRSLHHLQEIPPPFAACAIDSKSRTLRLISDPYGHHPLYYSYQNGFFVFCTQLFPLLHCGLIDWHINQKAVLDFFTYEHLMGNDTLVEEVHVLPEGAILKFSCGKISIHKYTQPPKDITFSLSQAEAAKLLHKELSSAVASAVKNKDRVAIPLSGGLDSRALLGTAVAVGANVKTYTIGIKDCADRKYAKQLADTCGVENKSLEIGGSYLLKWLQHGIYTTGGMVSCVNYHILTLSELLSSEADVVLDGLGGDALTGAHINWKMATARKPSSALLALYRQRAVVWKDDIEREKLFLKDFLSLKNYQPKKALEKNFLMNESPWRGCQRFDLLERQRRFIQFGPHQLRPFLNVQSPFYSHKIRILSENLSIRQLFEQHIYLNMHRKYLAPLSRIPDAGMALPLSWPHPIRVGKKAMKTANRLLEKHLKLKSRHVNTLNYTKWFREDIREFVSDSLLYPNPLFKSIIRPKKVENILKEFYRENKDHATKIGALLTFCEWTRLARKDC